MVLNKAIPDFLLGLQGSGEAFEDVKQMGLSGRSRRARSRPRHPAPTTTRSCHRSRHGRGRPRGTTSSAQRGSVNSAAYPPGPDGPMVAALEGYNGGRVLVFVMGAFAEMPGDVSRICDIIAHGQVPLSWSIALPSQIFRNVELQSQIFGRR